MSGSLIYSQIFHNPPVPNDDRSGQTVIITGGNSGLGFDAAKHFVRLRVSRLILACRNTTKGEDAKKTILASQGQQTTQIDVWPIDMGSYPSVLAFAQRCKTLPRLDALVANAGVSLKEYSIAEDNETTLTVNVISTFLLAFALMPVFRESARRHHTTPRLTFVGSAVHFWADQKQLTAPPRCEVFDNLNSKPLADMEGRYYLSKLILQLCAQEMASRLSANATRRGNLEVIVNIVNPAWCKTELFRHEKGTSAKIFLMLIGRKSEAGSRTLVHAASAGSETHGKFMSESKVKDASPFARSQQGIECQQNLWEELTIKLEEIQPDISKNL